MTSNEKLISYENIFKVDDSNYLSNGSEKSFLQNISIKSEEFNNFNDEEQDESHRQFCLKCEKDCSEFSISWKPKEKESQGTTICEICDNSKTNSTMALEKLDFDWENYFTELKKHCDYFENYDQQVLKFEEKLEVFIDEQFLQLKKQFKLSFKSEIVSYFNLVRIKEDVKIFEKMKNINDLSKDNIKSVKQLLERNKSKVDNIKDSYLKVMITNEKRQSEIKERFKKIERILSFQNFSTTNFNFSLENNSAKRNNRDYFASENNMTCLLKKPNSYIKSVKTNPSPLKAGHQKTKSFNIFHQQFHNRMIEVNESKNAFTRLIDSSGGLEVIKENIENIQLVNNTIKN